MTNYCGIDFGTSNSCVATVIGNETALAPVENLHTTIPSAIFFPGEGDMRPFIGRQAVEEYLAHEPGRLMRGLKSVLGSSLINEATKINRRMVPFREIVGMILTHLKQAAETHTGSSIDSVVLGRPVHFVGAGERTDETAEKALIDIATACGFKHIEMQLEPIAAALEYETTVAGEELVLIVDIGGGTTDFSLIRTHPAGRNKADRREDILSNGGVAIGGTDFDQRLSLAKAMPFFGFRQQIRRNEFDDAPIEAPVAIFFDLATWHKIMFAYTPGNIQLAKTLKRLAFDEAPFNRLLYLLEERLAHYLAKTIEDKKIDLTAATQATLDLGFIEARLSTRISRSEFEQSIGAEIEAIGKALTATIDDAGVAAEDVSTVFLTGGTCHTPIIKGMVRDMLPSAEIKSGDMFGSVGRGLGLQAQRIFGRA